MKYLLSILCLFVFSCKGDTGCRDEFACNYDGHAILGGHCTYPEENFDCYGNCLVDIDCEGECGGLAEFDECGVCGGDNSTCSD